ncbi:acyl-CoA Delta-9 desaturase-like isoform X2 [Neodiprion virginianus]|uniref:acyl-CoA Delta-9 desaturase-like isoform X2 n=1 Tax=Neodiprion virginianus TaxID=2961670 RepID=UPI001EE6A307|nr:acyl-CoA Delta-9 desaturase-like isoform X2 [Neodiprion virginianus]
MDCASWEIMPPNIVNDSTALGVEFQRVAGCKQDNIVIAKKNPAINKNPKKSSEGPFGFETTLIWPNIVSIALLHLIGMYMAYTIPFQCRKLTLFWGLLIGMSSGFGVTGGVHRLWSHRSYKAKWPLRVILIICYSIAGQNTIYDWVRDHRVHHKYTETDADPHNSNRGFFFAHVGWLMMRKHPEVIRRGRQVDMTDVLSDPIVQFHQRYFWQMKLLFCFVIPIVVPVYFWNETWYISIMSQIFIRYIAGLNFTWLVNSAAHMWGTKPYDSGISPVENLSVAIVAMGEGWHNYHHVFPWDYKAAELGNYTFNVTTFLIDMFAKIGWAYDLKQPSAALVRKVAEKHGDGSHHAWREAPEPEEQ